MKLFLSEPLASQNPALAAVIAKIAAKVIAVVPPEYEDSIKQSIADTITRLKRSKDEGAPPPVPPVSDPYGR